MKFICAFFMLVAGPTAFGAPPPLLPPACQGLLVTYDEEQILDDAGEVLAGIEMPAILDDQVNPLLGLLEPMNGGSEKYAREHELATARDYATFLHRTFGERYVFTARFHQTDVPVFDGFVLERDGRPSFNVSLKYVSKETPRPYANELLSMISGRLNHEREERLTGSLFRWLHAVNDWEIRPDQSYTIRQYARDLRRGVVLAYVFGLTNPHRFPIGRELMTVLDMRDSGYPYEFVNRGGLKRQIKALVAKQGSGTSTLTLLWDDRRVLEFGKYR